jgi:hypothetical protein
MMASAATLTGQGNDRTLRGTVTIKTSGHTVAVHGKGAPPDTDFLFCIDQDRSTPGRRIEFTGPARVLYRAVPIPGIPAGVVINGPESVANTLVVVADDGQAWSFVGKDQKPLLAAGDRALAKGTTVGSSVVRRLDWATGNGPRRGTDVAGCLQPGG